MRDPRQDSNTAEIDGSTSFMSAMKDHKRMHRDVRQEDKRRESHEARRDANTRKRAGRRQSPFKSLIIPTDPLAALYIAEEETIETRKKALSQTNPRGPHVNGAVGIIQIIETGEFILSVDKKKQLPGEPRRFCFPGGGKEGIEDSRTTLSREIREELRLNVNSIKFEFVELVLLNHSRHLKQAVFFGRITLATANEQLRVIQPVNNDTQADPGEDGVEEEQLAIERLPESLIELLVLPQRQAAGVVVPARMTANHRNYWTAFKKWRVHHAL